MTHNSRWLGLLVVSVISVAFGACIPYTVGGTAQPLASGETQPTMSVYFIPQGIRLWDSSATFTGLDFEVRHGLEDGASDVGIRIPMMSGLIVTYKRRLTPSLSLDDPALAILAGMGFVNWGQHAHGEITLLASARQRGTLTPYGGLRVMQVLPLSESAVSDSPTAGGFLGLRIGRPDLGISPEVAIYYDRSALEVRQHNVIVVPAITVHGSELLSILGGIFMGRRRR